jgi:hypothetical protein
MEHMLETPRSGMAIHELILEAHQDNLRDRRATPRFPFFRRIAIRMPGAEPVAFSREISSLGIGMLHNVELELGEVELAIPNKRGLSIRVRTRIRWCQPCGEGWYISGGEFVGAASVIG